MVWRGLAAAVAGSARHAAARTARGSRTDRGIPGPNHGRTRKVAVSLALQPAMPQTLAPDDVVRSPEEGAANARVPLLVLEPLEAFLDEHGAGRGPVDRRAGRRRALQRDVRAWSAGARASCCAARRGRRCRPAPTTCCARRGSCRRWPDRPCAPRRSWPCAPTRRSSARRSTSWSSSTATSSPPSCRRRWTPPAERRRIGEELVDALVELHAVDWRAAGLEGFGKPTGYLERQVRRFLGLWEHNRTREIPAVERVAEWLRREHARVRPRRRSSTATTGWATRCTRRRAGAAGRDLRLGDGDDRRSAGRRRLPLHDVGEAEDPPGGMADLTAVTRGEGFPTRAELVARYEEGAGAR